MSFEHAAMIAAAESEARREKERGDLHAKQRLEKQDMEKTIPNWGVELAAAVARRGLAAHIIMSYKNLENVDEHSIANEVYTRPAEKKEGWVINWKDASDLARPTTRVGFADGFALSKDGEVWKRYEERLWTPFVADGVPTINHGMPVIDAAGRYWLRLHSAKADRTIGVHEDSYYNRGDDRVQVERVGRMGQELHYSGMDLMSQIAISTLVTIDTKPDRVSGSSISLDEEVLRNNDTLQSYLHPYRSAKP